jgi:hypothetical protein
VDVRDYVFSAGINQRSESTASTSTSTSMTEQFTVAIMTVTVPAPVWLYRPHSNSPIAMHMAAASTATASGSDTLDRNNLYPEEMSDTAYGLTALHCNVKSFKSVSDSNSNTATETIVFESTPPSSSESASTSWLVPLEPVQTASDQSSLYRLIASLVYVVCTSRQ